MIYRLASYALIATETVSGAYALYAFCSGWNTDLWLAGTWFIVARGGRLASYL